MWQVFKKNRKLETENCSHKNCLGNLYNAYSLRA